jgi:8-oxo-dGTP pyrophosphatase MutT (NUDIX family)
MAAWSRVAHPRLHGVKCVLRDGDGRLLLVRHTYGDRRAWELPGGGSRRGEDPAAAAQREAREELGVDIGAWRELGDVYGEWTGARLTLTCLEAPWPAGATLTLDPVEIADAAWWAPGALPEPLGEVTRAAASLVAHDGLRRHGPP